MNKGEIFRGDRVVATAFQIHMLTNVRCKMACKKKTLTAEQSDLFRNLIINGYTSQMYLNIN